LVSNAFRQTINYVAISGVRLLTEAHITSVDDTNQYFLSLQLCLLFHINPSMHGLCLNCEATENSVPLIISYLLNAAAFLVGMSTAGRA
jgi:hypothetical protein